MWGENWGTMIWGNAATQVPLSMPALLVMGAILLGLGMALGTSRGARRWLVMAAVVLLPLAAVAQQSLFVFSNGTVADATEVNSNFSQLDTRLGDLEVPIAVDCRLPSVGSPFNIPGSSAPMPFDDCLPMGSQSGATPTGDAFFRVPTGGGGLYFINVSVEANSSSGGNISRVLSVLLRTGNACFGAGGVGVLKRDSSNGLAGDALLSGSTSWIRRLAAGDELIVCANSSFGPGGGAATMTASGGPSSSSFAQVIRISD